MQYYPFFPGDYHRDTMDLSLLEHGAYRIMLDFYYSDGQLPADSQRLYRICKAITKDEMAAVDFIVDRFFVKNGGTLLNKKADKVIKEMTDKYLSGRKKGLKGASARWGKNYDADEEPGDFDMIPDTWEDG